MNFLFYFLLFLVGNILWRNFWMVSNNFLCGRLLDGSVFPDSTLDFFDTWTSDGSSACSLDAGFDNLLFGFQEYL
ncbi:hypothetical protein RhiirB3_529704 [Rhizophagus irregularis]|nr:hypothetical protein RhiirB3_529704 [Rhizophagus irregularis]